MPSKPPILYQPQLKLLAELGARLRLARLRRQLSAEVVAKRASISRMTLSKAESGSPAVTMGTYLKILDVLNLMDDLNLIAKDDVLGRRLQDLEITTPKRAAKRTR
jgi:transcriptional regulator with XRE-family HTH domain